ncbi:protein ripply1 isoform X3 [Urocitellus parryii]|uniref:protein ripply1 isoform X3 n=1 Tax=Urocitellus parryii TaxID=9999 RepID=UPI000E55E1A7|nr:protein ripply1 isoform X3 [Urocitellus parryii]
MDPAAPAALVPVPDLALALPPVSQELPGLLHPSSLLSSGQEIPGSERLFWPKSRSFDYLYSAGEILLQNFPVQATINLYEDSNSEDEEEEEEEEEYEEEKEEANKKGPEGCVRVPGPAPHRATAPPVQTEAVTDWQVS